MLTLFRGFCWMQAYKEISDAERATMYFEKALVAQEA